MQTALINQIDDNVERELGDAASSLNADILLYINNVFRDVAGLHEWSWLPKKTPALADIKRTMPNSFATIIELGVLRNMDSVELKQKWADVYYNEIELKKQEDILGVGNAYSVKNPTIAGYRDSVFRDIAAYYQWSWLEEYPLTLATDSGEEYITFPDYLGEEITIYQEASGREILYIPPQDYDRLRGGSVATSAYPENYTIKSNRIYFYQPAEAGTSFKVFGTIDANKLTDTDSPAVTGVKDKMPADFNTIVEWGILRKLDGKEKYGGWTKKYFGELEVKKQTDRRSKGRKIGSSQDRVIMRSRQFMQN